MIPNTKWATYEPPVQRAYATEPDGQFGRLIRQYREAAGLSQKDIAERTGLHYSYISRIESGSRLPGLDGMTTVTALIRALSLTTTEALALLEAGGIADELRGVLALLPVDVIDAIRTDVLTSE